VLIGGERREGRAGGGLGMLERVVTTPVPPSTSRQRHSFSDKSSCEYFNTCREAERTEWFRRDHIVRDPVYSLVV